MDRKEYAVQLRHSGYNCCQAVLCAFTDKDGEENMKKLGAGFALGMGNMEGTCGALIAAEMLLGLKAYDGKPLLKKSAAVQEVFKAMCGATLCKDIKGRDTGKILCDCDDCVRNAVAIAESELLSK